MEVRSCNRCDGAEYQKQSCGKLYPHDVEGARLVPAQKDPDADDSLSNQENKDPPVAKKRGENVVFELV